MPKRILTPAIIEEPLATIQLKYTEASIKQAALILARPEPIDEVIEGFISSPGPFLTIGRPEWWHLTPHARQYLKKYPQKPASQDVLSRYLHESDLYLLMVSCAFQADVERQILEARLTVNLRPQIGKNRPVVLDLFPRDVLKVDKASIAANMDISSALRFEISPLPAEEALMSVEMKDIPPVIAASLADPSAPLWTYKAAQAGGLVDARFAYMIVAKPRQAKFAILQIDVRADVSTPQGCFNAEVKEKDKAVLIHTVCREWIDV